MKSAYSRESETKYRISKGFVPNMKTEGSFYVNRALESLVLGELRYAFVRTSTQLFLLHCMLFLGTTVAPGGMEGFYRQ